MTIEKFNECCKNNGFTVIDDWEWGVSYFETLYKEGDKVFTVSGQTKHVHSEQIVRVFKPVLLSKEEIEESKNELKKQINNLNKQLAFLERESK